MFSFSQAEQIGNLHGFYANNRLVVPKFNLILLKHVDIGSIFQTVRILAIEPYQLGGIGFDPR